MNQHEIYIKRCITIAKKGIVMAAPNPSVGAVIVYDDKIIGEGFTAPYGGAHAEVNAINAVSDKELLKYCTLYVSLEPCSHFGKTPPCCNLIIKHNFKCVVIGASDPNPLVAGSGILKIRNAGIKVIENIMSSECELSNHSFFTYYKKKRPFIILKWAQTQDGFIAPSQKKINTPVWITNEFSRQLVHKWRSETQAILVGTQTVIDDNPSLTTRDWFGKNPIRIVLDQHEKISKKNHIFDNQAKTIIITANDFDFNENLAYKIVDFLYFKKIQSVIIEGGTKTIQNFIDTNLWDQARVFVGNSFFGKGTVAPKLKTIIDQRLNILDDQLLIYTNNDKCNNF